MHPNLSAIDNRIVNCNICLEVINVNEILTLSQCGCKFCRHCLQLYLTTVLSTLRVDICQCPSLTCDGHLTLEEVESLLSRNLFTWYKQQLEQREVQRNPLLTYCPSPDCGAVCRVADDNDMEAKAPSSSNNAPAAPLVQPTNQRVTANKKQWPLKLRSSSGGGSSSFKHRRRRLHVNQHAASLTTTESSMSSDDNHGRQVAKSSSKSVDVTQHVDDHRLASKQIINQPQPIKCHECGLEFCLRCHLTWHASNPQLCCSSTTTTSNHKRRFTRFSDLDKSCLHRGGRQRTADQQPSFQSIASSSNNRPVIVRPTTSRSQQIRRLLSSSSLTTTAATVTLNNDATSGELDDLFFPPYQSDAWVKRCPACFAPIERVEGCAQMMCRSCQHTFCWYCLQSLENDFLLHHYDKGSCQGLLGHSRSSILAYRIYVVSVMAGLGCLFLFLAPFFILSVPCLACAHLHHRLVAVNRRQRGRHGNKSTDQPDSNNQGHSRRWSSSTIAVSTATNRPAINHVGGQLHRNASWH